jgi:AbrB family looped-hinge helix DNA binding protein
MQNHRNMNTHIPVGHPAHVDLPQLFGSVKVGERGQVVIPQAARGQMGIKAGDKLLAIGGVPGGQGLILIKAEAFSTLLTGITSQMARLARLLETMETGTASPSVTQKAKKRSRT